jgi:hypothetical protein
MGSLHPYEQVLTVVVAFGPFVLLAVVVWLRRGDGSAVVRNVPTPDHVVGSGPDLESEK